MKQLQQIVKIYELEDTAKGRLKPGDPFHFAMFGKRYVKPYKHFGPIIEVGRDTIVHKLMRRLRGAV